MFPRKIKKEIAAQDRILKRQDTKGWDKMEKDQHRAERRELFFLKKELTMAEKMIRDKARRKELNEVAVKQARDDKKNFAFKI